jgi:hypothetical protein
MEVMKYGDILMYLDSGCEIGDKKQFFNYVKKDKIIGTYTPFIEKNWCKMDLLIHFNIQNTNIINSKHRQAGALMFYVCIETKKLVNSWYNISCNYHMIYDSPSMVPNDFFLLDIDMINLFLVY